MEKTDQQENVNSYAYNPYAKQRAYEKVSKIPISVEKLERPLLKKPDWIKVKINKDQKNFHEIKNILRENNLKSVCEEASCPNINECFNKKTATFMIMGESCTRRCPFCDVSHSRPLALDQEEPLKLAMVIKKLALKHVVITSVNRDDLKDAGASHFVSCVQEIKKIMHDSPHNIDIELLVPDFRGRLDLALDVFKNGLPKILNHNLETVPRLYKQVRPGADYQHSLNLLKRFKQNYPELITKSGLMVGVGEKKEEIIKVMQDMREHDIDMLTIGQYLAPSLHHLPVQRYVQLDEFAYYHEQAQNLGFLHASCGPLVRSSYHADLQAQELK